MSVFGFNSLDGLRLSIAARLNGGVDIHASRDDLSPLIGEMLLGETRDNERRIAAFRAVLATVYLALGIAAWAIGERSISPLVLLAAFAWAAYSAGVYAMLRRGASVAAWPRRVIPLVDAIAITAGALLVVRGDLDSAAARGALAANVSLLCAFLVFTGALRLTRVATLISSVLAIAAFVAVALIARLAPMPTIAISAGLIALSVLSRGVTDTIRRVVANEVERRAIAAHAARVDARLTEAQAASTAREEVLRIVAHDLRNPLGTLLMAADLLREPSMSEEARTKQAALIKRTGSRMNHLIQDLLNVARMETGRLAIDPSPVAPEQLVAHAVELMRPLAVEKTLMLDEDCPSGLPPVNADAERLNQVFSNLIGNAIKFTPPGGRITVRAEAADGKVWFTVTDTGPGIPPEQVAQVFGEFWQARRTDRRGIGLGLTIAKGIVEAHGGQIGVSSEVGVGTRFWFGLGT